jgi:hypothetical protein
VLLAAFIGGIVAGFLACLLAGGTVSVGLTPVGGGAITILCLVTGAANPISWIIAAIGFVVMGLVAAVIVLIDCSNRCAVSTPPLRGDAQRGSGLTDLDGLVPDSVGLAQEMTCATAREMAATAMLKRDLALQRRDDAQRTVDDAARTVRKAQAAQRVAIGAVLATPFWNLWAFAVALAALAALTAAVLHSTRSLAAAQAALIVADAALRLSEGVLAASEALASKLCATNDTPSVPTAPTTPTTPVVTVSGVKLV